MAYHLRSPYIVYHLSSSIYRTSNEDDRDFAVGRQRTHLGRGTRYPTRARSPETE